MAAIVREWRTLRVRILDGPPSFLVAVFRRIHGLKPLLRQPPAHHKPSLSTDRGYAMRKGGRRTKGQMAGSRMSFLASAAETRFTGASESVGQREVDGNNRFGFDPFATDRGRCVAPERDGVHGDLRKDGIAADAGKSAGHTVLSYEGADSHGPLQVSSASLQGITRCDAFDDCRRLIAAKGRVRHGSRGQFRLVTE